MTKETAIELALKACEETWNEKTCKQIRKALEQEPNDKYIKEIDHLRKYISKLETQIVEQEPSGDAISREDKKHIDGFKYWCETNEENGTITIPKFVCDEIVKILDELPLVNLQEPCDDVISRQYLLDNCVVDKVTMPYVPVNKIENAPPVTPHSEAEQFAKWVAEELFDDLWEDNPNAFDGFAELACRKLEKLGLVRANGGEWELVEPQEGSE